MPESSATLLRAAGYAAYSIIPVVIASGVAFWLFLNGAGTVFGPINDLLVAACLGLLVLPVVAIRSILGPGVGPWFDLLSGLAIVGLAVAAIGQVLLVIGVIPLEGSFVTGGLGILPVLAWILAVGVLAGRVDGLPDQLAWVTAILLALVVALALGSAMLPGPAVAVLSVALLFALTGWCVVVGVTCLGAAVRQPLPASA